MRFGIVTNEEAAFIKAVWWRQAKVELIAWAVCFAIGYAIFAEPLSSFHWPKVAYWAIAGGSLLLFSRLAIWIALIGGLLAHGVGWIAYSMGHPLFLPVVTASIIGASILAIILRSPVSLFFFLSLGSSVRMAGEHARAISAEEKPEYDYQFDQYVFKSGRREPAFLRYPRYEDRPENRDRH